jgi:hypothetical protein
MAAATLRQLAIFVIDKVVEDDSSCCSTAISINNPSKPNGVIAWPRSVRRVRYLRGPMPAGKR